MRVVALVHLLATVSTTAADYKAGECRV